MAPPKFATPAASQASQDKKDKTNIKIIRTTDYNLETHLSARKIVRAQEEEKPKNYEEIMKMVEKYRFMGSQEELQKVASEYQRGMRDSENECLTKYTMGDILDLRQFRNNKFLRISGEFGWNKRVKPFTELLNEDLRPPKPDFSLGIRKNVCPALALLCLGGFAQPSLSEQIMPFLTIEAKSVKQSTEQGTIQNLYNGAIMVNNILHLKTKLDSDTEFYGVARVFSFCIDQYNVQVSMHWVERKNGNLKFFGEVVMAWNLQRSITSYIAARQALHNIIDELEHTLAPELKKDIEKLEANLIAKGITEATLKPDDGKPVGWEGTETLTEISQVEDDGSSDELSRK